MNSGMGASGADGGSGATGDPRPRPTPGPTPAPGTSPPRPGRPANSIRRAEDTIVADAKCPLLQSHKCPLFESRRHLIPVEGAAGARRDPGRADHPAGGAVRRGYQSQPGLVPSTDGVPLRVTVEGESGSAPDARAPCGKRAPGSLQNPSGKPAPNPKSVKSPTTPSIPSPNQLKH